MHGAIIGDIIGSRFEFDDGHKSKEFELFTDECDYTDDTVMTIAVAEALMDAGPDADEKTIKDLLINSMKKWGKKYPYAGYGSRFIDWVLSDDAEPYGSYGNGSGMRVSSAGWLYNSLDRTREVARWTAEITHNHPEGIKGAESTAAAIFLARQGASKDEIQDYIESEFGYDLSRTLDDIRPGYYHVEDCMRTMPEAFECFLESESYEDCIRNVMYIGGDTDTLGAIAGAIAEAYWGLPLSLIIKAKEYLPEDIDRVINRFNDVVHGSEKAPEDTSGYENNKNIKMAAERVIITNDVDDKIIPDFEREHDKFVTETVNDAISKLTEADKKELLEHPDPVFHHLGYGMYIRNHYIHGKELPFPVVFADDLSAEIVEEIIKKVQLEAGKN